MVEKILLAVLGSGNIILFIKFLIERHDTKHDISGKLTVLEKDGLRTQLLVLILLRPEEKQEILTIGEHYFKVLHGNWYMTSIFNKWLEDNKIARPEWFKTE